MDKIICPVCGEQIKKVEMVTEDTGIINCDFCGYLDLVGIGKE